MAIDVDTDLLVSLDAAQIELAATVGSRRLIESLRRNGREKYPDHFDNQWERKIQSAAAELAVSIGTNQRWSGVHDGPGGPDVGDNIEVRWTKNSNGHLLVFPKDPDERSVVLVIGSIPKFILCGWVYAVDAKRPEYSRTLDVPCFWIPQSALRPIVDLIAE
jgi:hypothetical protein